MLTEEQLEPQLAVIDRLVKGKSSWTEIIESSQALVDYEVAKARHHDYHSYGRFGMDKCDPSNSKRSGSHQKVIDAETEARERYMKFGVDNERSDN